jgi:tetratricopeptide (TPR) repeat protein
MANLIQFQAPPFFLTYWNPFNENANLVENWFDYVKNVTLAKYAANSVGRYIQEASADRITAIDATGQKICGELYAGFSDLEKQLGLVTGKLESISGALEGIDSRLGLLVDETRTSNLLLENVAELLRIPDSQKERQHHIEMGLKFLKNALKDEDLYQDALTELLEAEKLMPSDYFVLHRIGMIYLYVPALGNPEKALEYFIKAGKYAAVESDPDAARLSNFLNKRVTERFNEQAELAATDIGALAAESYSQAGTSLYVLGRFGEAAKMAEKAVKYQPGEAKHYFFLAKYLARSGNADAAVPQLQKAIEKVPEIALGAIADFDLNKAQPILDLLNRLDEDLSEKLGGSIEVLKGWPQSGYGSQEVQQLVAEAKNSLEIGNFAEKTSLLAKIKEWEFRLSCASELTEATAFGVSFNIDEFVRLIKHNEAENAKGIISKRRERGVFWHPKLQTILRILATSPSRGIEELAFLATVDSPSGNDEDEELIQQCIEVIRSEQKASVSLLQRRLRLGYTRAARIMDELESRGVVGPSKSAEPRDIFIDSDELIQRHLQYILGPSPDDKAEIPVSENKKSDSETTGVESKACENVVVEPCNIPIDSGEKVEMPATAFQVIEKFKPEIQDKRIFFYPNIPSKMLQKVGSTYAKAATEKNETILCVIDFTLFARNASDGLALTANTIYWHSLLERDGMMPLCDILQATYDSPHLKLNAKLEILTAMRDTRSMELIAELINTLRALK